MVDMQGRIAERCAVVINADDIMRIDSYRLAARHQLGHVERIVPGVLPPTARRPALDEYDPRLTETHALFAGMAPSPVIATV